MTWRAAVFLGGYMIKFIAQRGDRKVLGMGLSRENFRRLERGKGIYFAGEQLGLDGLDVVIVFGETEDDIATDLERQCNVVALQTLQ